MEFTTDVTTATAVDNTDNNTQHMDPTNTLFSVALPEPIVKVDPKKYSDLKGVVGNWKNYFSKSGVCLLHDRHNADKICNKSMKTSSPHSRMKHVWVYHRQEYEARQKVLDLLPPAPSLLSSPSATVVKHDATKMDIVFVEAKIKSDACPLSKKIKKPKKERRIVDSQWISRLCMMVKELQQYDQKLSEKQIEQLLIVSKLLPDAQDSLELSLPSENVNNDVNKDQHASTLLLQCKEELRVAENEKIKTELRSQETQQELEKCKKEMNDLQTLFNEMIKQKNVERLKDIESIPEKHDDDNMDTSDQHVETQPKKKQKQRAAAASTTDTLPIASNIDDAEMKKVWAM